MSIDNSMVEERADSHRQTSGDEENYYQNLCQIGINLIETSLAGFKLAWHEIKRQIVLIVVIGCATNTTIATTITASAATTIINIQPPLLLLSATFESFSSLSFRYQPQPRFHTRPRSWFPNLSRLDEIELKWPRKWRLPSIEPVGNLDQAKPNET